MIPASKALRGAQGPRGDTGPIGPAGPAGKDGSLAEIRGISDVPGLTGALFEKASASDVSVLRSEVAAIKTQIPTKRIEVVSSLPSWQDPDVIYFEEA